MHRGNAGTVISLLAAVCAWVLPMGMGAQAQSPSSSLETKFTTIAELLENDDYAQAESAARAALAEARAKKPAEPLKVAVALRLLGHALSNQDKNEEALPFRREAVAIWRQQPESPDQKLNLAKALANLASQLDDAGQSGDEARRLHDEAIALFAIAEPNSTNNRAGAMLNYASHFISRNETDVAIKTLEAALDLIEKDPSPALSTQIALLNNLGNLYDKKANLQASISTYQRQIALYSTLGNEAVEARNEVRISLSTTLARAGKDSEAEAQVRLAVNELRSVLGDDHASVQKARQLLASTIASLGRTDEARVILNEVLNILRQSAPAALAYQQMSDKQKEARIRLISALGSQCIVAMAGSDATAAEALCVEALGMQGGLPPSAQPVLTPAKFGLGFMRVRQRRYEEGIPLLTSVVAASTTAFGADDPFTLFFSQQLGLAYMASGEVEAGLKELQRIRMALMAQPSGWNPRRSEIRETYADFLLVMERPQPAYLEFADVGQELLSGPGRSAALDPAARQAFMGGSGIFLKQIKAGWLAAQTQR